MSVTIKVMSDNKAVPGVIAAFLNNELRGVRASQYTSVAGDVIFLTIYGGNSADELTFRFWDYRREITLKRTLKFQINAIIGNLFDPFIFTYN